MDNNCKVCKEKKKRWEEARDLIYKHNPWGDAWKQLDRILEGKQMPFTIFHFGMLDAQQHLRRMKHEAKMRGWK